MSKGLIEPTLKKYFMNYDTQKLDFSLLSGDLRLKDLFFNKTAVNESLDKKNIPFQLNFGMITNVHIKVSILGFYIENIEIEDLILVMSPDASKGTSFADKKFDKDLKEQVWLHMAQNYMALRSGQNMTKLNLAQWAPEALIEDYQKREKEALAAFSENGPLQEVPTSATTAVQSNKANLMGPELFGIITGRLDFNIKIKNIRIYYEDSDRLNRSFGRDNSHISFCFNITEVTLQTVSMNNSERCRQLHR